MNPRYKGFNKYQPTCKDELEKYSYFMERGLATLQTYRDPPEGLLHMLLNRVTKYKSLLPKKGTESKPSLLFPEFNK